MVTARPRRKSPDLGKQMAIYLGRTRDAIPILQRAVDLADAHSQLADVVDTLCALAYAQRINLHVTMAKENAARAGRMIDDHPELIDVRSEALAELGFADWYLAEWEDARNTIREAFHLALATGRPVKILEVGANYFLLCRQAGLAQEARNLVRSFLTSTQSTGIPGDSDIVMALFALTGLTYLMTDEIDEAERWIERTRHGGRDLIPGGSPWPYSRLWDISAWLNNARRESVWIFRALSKDGRGI